MENDNKKNKVVRSFFLSTWALNNKNTVYLILLAIITFGTYSYVSMPKELFPDINMPTVMVQTLYPGNAPVDIENLITRHLEKEIESVKGIKEMTSLSSQDVSNIFVEFQTNVEISTALQDVKDAVDKAKSDLPNDLIEDPMVADIDFSEFPVININLSGEFSINELKDYGEDLKDEFEAIYEVSKVNITGVTDREVKINLDPFKMSALQVSFGDIENAVISENISMSGGDIKMGNIKRSIRLIGEFADPMELENIIVKSEKGNIVYLKDVGFVVYGFAERDSYSRLEKNPVVSLQVVKKSGENLLSTIEQVINIINESKEANIIPENLVISITQDQSEMVKMQLSNLENSILLGMIFVIIVLFLFLGTRNSLFVGLAIPLSMLMSFMIMGMIGYKINMIVLFALVLALGMLVDNAIVVTENIYRYVWKDGYSVKKAAMEGTGEVAMPIITSTATTLAAFFPLIFWDSLMGEFMSYLPVTLIIVLASSLFVALVIIPVIYTDFFKKGSNVVVPKTKKSLIIVLSLLVGAAIFYALHINWIATLLVIFAILGLLNLLFLARLALWFQKVFLVWLEKTYRIFIEGALTSWRPYALIIGTFLLMIFTMAFYFGSNPKLVNFPSSPPKYLNILAEMPINTDIDVMDSAMYEIEDKVFEVLEPDMDIVKSVLTIVGKGAVGEQEGWSGRSGGSNRGLITVNFVEFEFRDGKDTWDVLNNLTEVLVGQYPGITISVQEQQNGPPSGKPINLEVHGRDFNTLVYLTDTIRSIINRSNIEGIEGLNIDLDIGKPEILVHIDREKARRYGLSTGQIGDALRTALFGKEVSDFKDGEDEFKIRMKLDDQYRYNLADLMNQRITFRSASTGKIVQVPISAVVSFEYSTTYGSITRIDRDRVITIYSNVLQGYNPTEINNELKQIMKNFKMPAGYNYEFTGEQEEQEESMAFLSTAMLIAVALIAIILVSQFNSFIKPAMIIFTVILSTIGVFGGLATFKMDFVVIMTGVGIVSLAGVVVNNGIVLIDYIGLLKQRKRKELGLKKGAALPKDIARECIVEGGQTRLRPVLLTAITTVLGLIPLATGFNIDILAFLNTFDPHIYFGGDNVAFWGPMSWTVIFGLSFATFLTLVIVPAMYSVLAQGKTRIDKAFSKK